MIEAGDVVTVFFIGAVESKRRPAIVISTPAFNDQHHDLVVALITTNLALASTPFDYHLQNWKEANLKGPSAVRTFIGMSEVRDARQIGRLSDEDWQEVQGRLKLAFGSLRSGEKWVLCPCFSCFSKQGAKMIAQIEIPALEFVKRFQAGEIPATARVTVVYEGAETPQAPTLALIEEWLAGAPTDPAAIAEAEADLREVQQALNATRESAGARILYPAMKSG